MSRACILNPYNAVCCQATRQTKYHRERNTPELKTCNNAAVYMVDGKSFCKVHAGQAALAALMTETAKETYNGPG